MKIVIEVKDYNDYIVVREETHNAFDLSKSVCEEIINLRDEAVRNKLIELGWTPPKECVNENLHI